MKARLAPMLAVIVIMSGSIAASAQTGPYTGPDGRETLPGEDLRGAAHGGQTIAPPTGGIIGGGASAGASDGVPSSAPSGLISAQDCQLGWRPAIGMSREEFLNACQNR